MKAKNYLKNNVPLLRMALETNNIRGHTEEVMEQYANERVIEVLDSLMASCVMSINYDLKDGINKRINELKQ